MAVKSFSGAITPSNQNDIVIAIAGGTIDKYDALYADNSDEGRMKPSNSTVSTQVDNVKGMALHAAVNGEYVMYARNKSRVTIASGLTAGERLVCGGSSGLLELQSDLSASEYICEFGYAVSSTVLVIDINYLEGVQA